MPATSKIILGTAQFGLNYGINNTSGKPDKQNLNAILIAAHSAGINCLDTAEAYGDAHVRIGNFHKENPKKIFNVITKLPHHIDESFDHKIEKYLKELCIERIEALLFHSYTTYHDNKSALALLNGYKQAGKVKQIGVSVYTNEQIEEVIEDDLVDIIQFPFNLFDNLHLRGNVIAKAKAKNKLLHTRSTFLQGLFFSSLKNENTIVEALKKDLQYIKQLSSELSTSIERMALNYCLQQPDIDNVLIGVDNVDQLNQNIADAEGTLPAEVINKINAIKINDQDLLNPSLWK